MWIVNKNKISFISAIHILWCFYLSKLNINPLDEDTRKTVKFLRINLRKLIQTNFLNDKHATSERYATSPNKRKPFCKMRNTCEKTYVLVPQEREGEEDEFVHYEKHLEHLLKIENIENEVMFSKYDFKEGKLNFQPKIRPNKPQVPCRFIVYGHGTVHGEIGVKKRSIMRSDDLLHYINDLFSNARLKSRPEVILTQCYGYLHIEGNFPNINVTAVSSSECKFTLMRPSINRNISVMLHIIEKLWLPKYLKNKLTKTNRPLDE